MESSHPTNLQPKNTMPIYASYAFYALNLKIL